MDRTRLARFFISSLLAVSAFASPAAAESHSFFYVGGGIGVASNSNYSLDDDESSGGSFFAGEYELEPGFTVNGHAGMLWGGIFATELEISHRSFGSEFGSVANAGADLEGEIDGNVSATGIMLNLDMPLWFVHADFERFSVIPHFGLGIGGASVSVSDLPTTNAFENKSADDSDFVFAYQFFTGIEIIPKNTLNNDRGFTFRLDYNYFATSKISIEDSGGQSAVGDGLGSHEFKVGVRYMWLNGLF